MLKTCPTTDLLPFDGVIKERKRVHAFLLTHRADYFVDDRQNIVVRSRCAFSLSHYSPVINSHVTAFTSYTLYALQSMLSTCCRSRNFQSCIFPSSCSCWSCCSSAVCRHNK